MRLSWPLIGRTGPMNTIASAISAPGAAGVVVCGAAGVGKSRVAREAVATANSLGFETRWIVGASCARTIPLGAFSDWAQPGVTDTVTLVRRIVESLTATASGARVVIGVDDAHLLDELSTFVVHQVVQRRAAKVVMTVRDDEPVPKAVNEIWKLGQFDRVDLQPLSAAETTALLATVLGGPVEHDAAQRLWQLTGGNALYLSNIVEQEVADGRLAPRDGVWRWSGEAALPPDLIGLVESRIGALPDSIADVLDVLAVADSMDLTTLTRITDPAAVEEAEVRNLINLESGERKVTVRVAHPLYGEVRRRRAPRTRLRRLRGLVATELAKTDDSQGVQAVVRRAALSIESDLTPDADLLLRAAHGAVWLADLHLADRLAEAAIDAGAGPEPSLVRAHALSWLGRGEEAEAVFDKVEQAPLAEDVRARLAFLRASNMLWALGNPEGAKEIIDEVADVASREARGYVDAFLTVYWFASDQPRAATRAAEELVLQSLPPVVGAEIAWALATMAADAGRTAEAVSVAEAGYAVATKSFDAPHMRFNIADAHVSALLLAGRIADALEVADRVRRQALNLPGAAQLLGTAVAGRAALGAGRLDSAVPLLETAVTGLSATHPLGWGYRYLIPHATALALRGSIAQAAAALDALDKRRRIFRTLDYERSLARAWVAAGEGAVSEAIAQVLSAAERAAAHGQFAAEVMCLQTATQFGHRGCGSRLRELEAVVEGPRVGLATRFAAALHDCDAAQLALVSQEFEKMGDLVAAVDAAAHAALAYRRHNLRGSALGCSTRASALAERCGGVGSPALRQAAVPLPLTDREIEIATLIAQGLSNRDVAQRLTLSVRTVESHVFRAMGKTGTGSREELAALMDRPGARRTGER